MGVQKLFIRKTQFVLVFRKVVFIIRVLWVSFFASMLTLFGFSRQCLFRFQEKLSIKQNYNVNLIQPEEDNQINGNITEVQNNKDGGGGEEEKSEPLLRFRFPTYEEFLGNSTNHPILFENLDDKFSHAETKEDYDSSEINPVAKSSNEFSYVEEITMCEIGSESKEKDGSPLGESLHVENVFGNNGNCSYREDTNISNSNGEASQQDPASVICNDLRQNLGETKVVNGEKSVEDVIDLTKHEDIMNNDSELPSDDESLVSDFESDSIAPSSMSSFRSSFIDSLSDGILSDIDFERAFEIDTSTEFGLDEVNLTKEALTKEDLLLQDLSKGCGDDVFADEDEDILEELKTIESNLEGGNRFLDEKHESKMGSKAENKQNEEKDFELENLSKGYEADDCDDEDEDILKELKNLESILEDGNGTLDKQQGVNMGSESENKLNEEKTSSGEQLSSDSDEQNGLETQWEHQDLVEQLKMEIRKVRAIGLPTILEESESPKISDDLKPWKIVEKYHHHGGTLDQLHKFYKTYKERMRKLDILNYQKMYAIGFLRLKDPLQSFTKNKISTSSLATIVSLDCWPCKPKSVPEIHQPVMKKFSKELGSDLEMVYVGQMCLSWEFLRWQYDKALELWDTDPHGIHHYNEVADKFQTFQVLLTRFLEDERFQGPRVHNYVKNRCVQRNLLQVPLIRDDNTRDRKERKVLSTKDAITSSQLVEIVEESIRILWKFIKSDKDTNNVTLLKCRGTSSNVELQNPADASLLGEIRSNLQKKQKKLKELSRSEKCILRKIQKDEEEEASDHVLYFFSQVDLRLVSRVLNMPRITTEQLVWCSDKLNNIHLVGRKLHVEPSVFLFPCS